MDVQLNDIALFVEVASRGSFSQAAEALGIPAATLSRRVTELERRVGVPLLTRTTRRIGLTEAGALYFERCRNIVEAARNAHEQLHDMAVQPKGRLRVSMSGSLGQLFLPLAIREFTQLYPEIDCDFHIGMNAVDPIDNPFDVMLRFGQQPDSSLISRQVALMTHHLYAAPSYLALHGTPRVPTDLSHHECLRLTTADMASFWMLHSGERMERVPVYGRLSANSIGVLGRLGGRGMGIVPLPMVEGVGTKHIISEGGLVRVLPDWHLTPVPLFALLPSRTLPAKTRAFLDFIKPRFQAPA